MPFYKRAYTKNIIHIKNNYNERTLIVEMENVVQELFTVEQAAKILGFKEITIRMKIYRGEIPVCRIGKRAIRIRKEVIDAIIKTGSYTAKEKN